MATGKMITKTKLIDGSLWYYRANANEPEEKYISPSPPTTGYEKDETTLSNKLSTKNNNINCVSANAYPLKIFSNVQLYSYLSSIPMNFKMGLDDLNNYVGHIIYKGVSSKDGHGIYYYITKQSNVVYQHYCLVAKLIEVKNGEFVIKQSPTMPVSQTGTYNISAVPFDTRYPCWWE